MANRTTLPTLVVAGAGYAGVLCANRLAGKLGTGARVVLITQGDVLTDRIRLHEAAARGRNVELPLRKLLQPSIERIDARVVGVDPVAHQLWLERDGEREAFCFDKLVLALGSSFAQRIPAQTAHALALRDARSARALASALKSLARGQRVAVVGGGLTAVELASEIADAHPRLSVELISAELLPALRGPAQDALRKALARVGVSVREGQSVSELERDAVRLSDGSRIPAAISVLATGFEPAPLGEAFLLPRAPDGRLPVDMHLRVIGVEDVFAVGDLAAPPSASIGSGVQSTRMGCASAMPLGAHAADQIVRELSQRALTPYHFHYLIQCISVGRRQGVIAFVNPDDQPTGRVLSGSRAALVKEIVCRFVIGALRLERMFAGFYAWPGRHHVPRLLGHSPKHLPG